MQLVIPRCPLLLLLGRTQGVAGIRVVSGWTEVGRNRRPQFTRLRTLFIMGAQSPLPTRVNTLLLPPYTVTGNYLPAAPRTLSYLRYRLN